MFQGAPPPYVCSPGSAAEKGAGPYDLHPALSSEYSRLRSLGFMPGERSSCGGGGGPRVATRANALEGSTARNAEGGGWKSR